MTPSLTIVGSGIQFLSHLSIQAKTEIEHSKKVLYLFNDPAMASWIQKQNPNTESLDPIYNAFPQRKDAYRAIAEHILKTLEEVKSICVVFYGHPTVFAQPALVAAKLAREKNYLVRIIPGISAEDCLFADLWINPGSCGCQSFEATDFLIHKRIFDANSHLILWQVGVIGVMGHAKKIDNTRAAKVLVEYLGHWYPPDHSVVLYEAAQYPGFESRISAMKLNELPLATFSRISTLYLPPLKKTPCDTAMLMALGMNSDEAP